MKKTTILKLSDHNEKLEIEFELNFLDSLSIQERFELLEEKNKVMKSLLITNGYRKTSEIIKRT